MSEILGNLIWEEMSDCIIRECLVHSIPTNSSQLAEYSAVRVNKTYEKDCLVVKTVVFVIQYVILSSGY